MPAADIKTDTSSSSSGNSSELSVLSDEVAANGHAENGHAVNGHEENGQELVNAVAVSTYLGTYLMIT